MPASFPTTVAAALALSLAAGSAVAQRNAIDIKVPPPGDTVWVDLLVIQSANPETIEVGVFYERASGYGFSGSVHNVLVSNWTSSESVTLLDRSDSAQHPDGRQGRFNFGAQRQQAYTTGIDAGRMRIGAANNTVNAAGGGISVKQAPPSVSGTLFDTSNPALGFRFDLHFSGGSSSTVWELTSPISHVANFAIYQTETSTSGSNVPLSSVVTDGALIVIPAPGSMFVGVGAGLFARRRRRD